MFQVGGKVPYNDIVGNVGNNVILPCTPPASVPLPLIQWYKEGRPVNISGDTRQSLVNHQHLLLENLGPEHAG